MSCQAIYEALSGYSCSSQYSSGHAPSLRDTDYAGLAVQSIPGVSPLSPTGDGKHTSEDTGIGTAGYGSTAKILPMRKWAITVFKGLCFWVFKMINDKW